MNWQRHSNPRARAPKPNPVPGRASLRARAQEPGRGFTETDGSTASEPDLLSLMRDSGCAQVLIGREAPSRAPLERMEQKSNWKARQFDGYREAIDRITPYVTSRVNR